MAQRDAAVDVALLTTVDRETKANENRHTAALNRQLAAGDRLVSMLKSGRRAERVVGARIAQAIAKRHLSGQLTAQQDAKAIALILGKLKARGVSRSLLKRMAPSGLVPARYDLLNHLR